MVAVFLEFGQIVKDPQIRSKCSSSWMDGSVGKIFNLAQREADRSKKFELFWVLVLVKDLPVKVITAMHCTPGFCVSHACMLSYM